MYFKDGKFKKSKFEVNDLSGPDVIWEWCKIATENNQKLNVTFKGEISNKNCSLDLLNELIPRYFKPHKFALKILSNELSELKFSPRENFFPPKHKKEINATKVIVNLNEKFEISDEELIKLKMKSFESLSIKIQYRNSQNSNINVVCLDNDNNIIKSSYMQFLNVNEINKSSLEKKFKFF